MNSIVPIKQVILIEKPKKKLSYSQREPLKMVSKDYKGLKRIEKKIGIKKRDCETSRSSDSMIKSPSLNSARVAFNAPIITRLSEVE